MNRLAGHVLIWAVSVPLFISFETQTSAFVTTPTSCKARATFANAPAMKMAEAKASSFQDGLIEKQKAVSEAESKSAPRSAIEDHLKHQRECFDEMSDYFNSEEATPPDVVPVLSHLVKNALKDTLSSIDSGDEAGEEVDPDQSKRRLAILDVGCGTGALFSTYLEAADELDVALDITGLDLSPKMMRHATRNAEALVDASSSSSHTINCRAGDFVQTTLGVEMCEEVLTGFDHGVVNDDTMNYRGKFDAVMINACFGNFYDTDSVVTAAANCLKVNGVFVVAHPLGADFVEKLGTENPSTVPNRLPSATDLMNMLRYQPLETIRLLQESEIGGEIRPLYYASMRKKRERVLRNVVRLRGLVDEGYGRGGKKLGFPTANLPSSLFADALADVPMGVYVGSASLEGGDGKTEGRGRDVVHKAVVNVGYSPTFDGEENKEKIVEAHLIIDEGDIEGDFYGETMRLSLSGFLRPEMKFPSFPDLIKAITNDVRTAKSSLDFEPYITFSNDPFLVNNDIAWVGKTGGDDAASYEFESTVEFLAE